MIFLSMAFLVSGMAISSCSNSANDSGKQGKEYTSAYVCTMHCEGSGSDKPGKCPVCGMEYQKNENHNPDANDHDNHDAHNH